jgi:hypothetical protein
MQQQLLVAAWIREPRITTDGQASLGLLPRK